jgi:predicted RNase H-like HicB family nuclease
MLFIHVEGRAMPRYAIEIFYSDEDEGYIATVLELPGCSAFGETEEAALREVKIAIELWLEVAETEGREIPHPRGKVNVMLLGRLNDAISNQT